MRTEHKLIKLYRYGNYIILIINTDGKGIVNTIANNNMQAVTSNAVNTRVGYYNTSNSYPSASIRQEIRNQFNSTAEFNYFFGKTNSSEEGAWWGFRQTNTGTGLFITRGYVIEFYLDVNSFRSKVIMAGL